MRHQLFQKLCCLVLPVCRGISREMHLWQSREGHECTSFDFVPAHSHLQIWSGKVAGQLWRASGEFMGVWNLPSGERSWGEAALLPGLEWRQSPPQQPPHQAACLWGEVLEGGVTSWIRATTEPSSASYPWDVKCPWYTSCEIIPSSKKTHNYNCSANDQENTGR